MLNGFLEIITPAPCCITDHNDIQFKGPLKIVASRPRGNERPDFLICLFSNQRHFLVQILEI